MEEGSRECRCSGLRKRTRRNGIGRICQYQTDRSFQIRTLAVVRNRVAWKSGGRFSESDGSDESDVSDISFRIGARGIAGLVAREWIEYSQ